MGSIRKLAVKKSDQDEEEKAERRTGAERRRFSYSAYIPERRTGEKRRKKTTPQKPNGSEKLQDAND
jgi:hypothetical protein